MPTLRTTILAAAAALLASGVTVAVTQGSGSAAQPAQSFTASGIRTLHQQVNLPPGVWTNTPLSVRLPGRGTYQIDADVRGRLQGNPPLNTFITARLWDASTGSPLLYSSRLVNQYIDYNAPGQPLGGNQTAPISELVSVAGPTTIVLQARDVNAVGAAIIAQVYSDDSGYTTLRYTLVTP